MKVKKEVGPPEILARIDKLRALMALLLVVLAYLLAYRVGAGRELARQDRKLAGLEARYESQKVELYEQSERLRDLEMMVAAVASQQPTLKGE